MLKTKYVQDIVTESGKHCSRIVTLHKVWLVTGYGREYLFLPFDAFIGTVEIKQVKYVVRYALNEQCWHVVSPYEGYYRNAKKHTLSDELRQQVYERNAYTCQHCGATENLSIDHIIPVFYGGETELDNLQVLCRKCNSRKGTRESVEEKKSIYVNRPEIQLLKSEVPSRHGIELPLRVLYEAPKGNKVYIAAGLVLVTGTYRKKEKQRPIRIVTSQSH